MSNLKEIGDLDMIDIISLIERRKGKFLALLMTDVEAEFIRRGYNTDINSPEASQFYILIRKFIFDGFNDYTRSIDRVLVGGNIEN